MDDQLVIGILLIIVGIAIGLIAVAVVLNRREDRIAAESDLAAAEPDLETDADDDEASDEDDPISEVDEDELDSEIDDDEPTEETDEPGETEEKAPLLPLERQLIAEIYREEVTGKLIVLSGDQEYLDGKQIENEAERRRLAYAASDLSDWFQGEFEFVGQSAAASSPPQAQSPDQMLEEINEILQRSLASTTDRGIRLFPDGVGGVKVMIGVKSYEIEDVPDDETKDLIRQAVAEWEEGQ